MRAYVQQGNQGDFNYLNLEQVAHWFWEKGYEVIRFEYPQLGEGFLDRGLLSYQHETIVAGGVGTIREALERAGRPLPENLDLPMSLDTWIGRKRWSTTLGEVRDWVNQQSVLLPVHIKPLKAHKKFTGCVVEQFSDLIKTAAVDDDVEVLAQEVVHFKSEWRASVLRDRIVNVSHYIGDPLRFPDSEILQSALRAFEPRPIACGMDWGVTEDGRTLLVEVNDGFALGNYGVRGTPYTAMIEARWREMMGLPDNGIGERL